MDDSFSKVQIITNDAPNRHRIVYPPAIAFVTTFSLVRNHILSCSRMSNRAQSRPAELLLADQLLISNLSAAVFQSLHTVEDVDAQARANVRHDQLPLLILLKPL